MQQVACKPYNVYTTLGVSATLDTSNKVLS